MLQYSAMYEPHRFIDTLAIAQSPLHVAKVPFKKTYSDPGTLA